MKLLVFQHNESEHPGSLRALLKRDNVECDVVNLDQGETIPNLQNYDALWVMGGPMDVWDVDEYPWLIEEKKAIRQWVTSIKKPFFGICLGHQLLADAMGGTCGPQRPAEIGVYEVELTEVGKKDPLFANSPVKQHYVQWHGVRVAQAPENTTVLAKSDECSIQAMRVGDQAWSMQYHVEAEADTVEDWAKVPENHQFLINAMGEDEYIEFRQQASDCSEIFMRNAEIVYNNFMQQVKNSQSS